MKKRTQLISLVVFFLLIARASCFHKNNESNLNEAWLKVSNQKDHGLFLKFCIEIPISVHFKELLENQYIL